MKCYHFLVALGVKLTEALSEGRFKNDSTESHFDQNLSFFAHTYLETDDTFSEGIFTLSEDTLNKTFLY